MPRRYVRSSSRSDSDRRITVRYEKRKEIDYERIAEVIIRVALHEAGDDTDTGTAGAYLQGLLAERR